MEEEKEEQAPVEAEVEAPTEAPAEDLDAKYQVQVINLLQELCDLIKASAQVDEAKEEAEEADDVSAFEELLD